MRTMLIILFPLLVSSASLYEPSRTCLAFENPPGLLYSTLLNGVQLNDRTGTLRLDSIQAVFLPEPASSDSWTYNATDGKLTALLSTADGKPLAEYRFYAQKLKGVFWQLGGYQVRTADGGTQDIKLTQAGDYLLQFSVEDNLFYEFPFSVTVHQSGDEYDPEQRYHLEGPWSNMGYVFYGGANPKSGIALKVWLRDIEKSDAFRSDKVDIKVVRKADGKLAAVSGTASNGTTYQLKPTWVRYSFELHTPKTVEPMTAQDILSTDGEYEVSVVVNEKPWVTLPLTIKNSQIEKAGRQVRKGTDPKRYVDGGRDAWWLTSKDAS